MYPRYFGLREPSFAITPDPQYLYLSRQHREALAHLLYGAGQGGGFVLLTGEVGTGKTTVCRAFLEQIPEDVDVALVLNPAMTAVELLHAICDEFGVEVPAGEASAKVLVDRLNAYLLDAHGRGRHPVLIIDEAQNLRPKVLEQIRLLTNLETPKQKLLQIFLIGQPELRALLASADLRQLNQRVTARFHLHPLRAAETAAYVEHRIAVAGVDRPLFTRAALRRVHRCSGGVPRLVNLICDRALLGAAVSRQLQVTPAIVRRAAREVRGDGPPIAPRIGRALAVAMGLVLAVGLGVWLGVSGLANDGLASLRTLAEMPPVHTDAPASDGVAARAALSDAAVPTISVAMVTDAPSITSVDSESARDDDGAHQASPVASPAAADAEPRATPDTASAATDTPAEGPLPQTTTETPQDETTVPTEPPGQIADPEPPTQPPTPRLSAPGDPADLPEMADAELSSALRSEPDTIAALVAAWGMSPPAGANVSCQSIRGLGLECARDKGRWSDLRLFDRPVALRLTPAGGGENGQLVITALDEEFATVDTGDGLARAPIAVLDERWSGNYLLLWRPPRPDVRLISRSTRGEVVQWLRAQLAPLPAAELADTESPIYDGALVRAVQRFQRGQGLSPDGIAGPRTLILLNNLRGEATPSHGRPSP